MDKHQGVIRMLGVVVVVFVVNVVLDVVFEPPMLLRWGIALAVAVVLTAVIEAGRRRRGTPANDHEQ